MAIEVFYCSMCARYHTLPSMGLWDILLQMFWSQIAIAALLIHDAEFHGTHILHICTSLQNYCILPYR